MGRESASGAAAAAAAAAADGVVSTQEALRQHKEWLVNFRRDMSLTAGATNHTHHHSSAAEHLIPRE